MYSCQHCSNRILADDLHEIYYEQLKTFLLTETTTSEYRSKTTAAIQGKESQLSVLTNEAATLRKRKTDLINMRLQGEMTKESFAEHFKPLEERLIQVDIRLPELQSEVDVLKIQLLSSDVVLDDAKDLYTKWPTMSFEGKRGIVETITTSITVSKEDISIKLTHVPPPSQNAGKKQPIVIGL